MTSPAAAAQIAGEPEKSKVTISAENKKIAKELRVVLRSGCLGLKGLLAKYLEAERRPKR